MTQVRCYILGQLRSCPDASKLWQRCLQEPVQSSRTRQWSAHSKQLGGCAAARCSRTMMAAGAVPKAWCGSLAPAALPTLQKSWMASAHAACRCAGSGNAAWLVYGSSIGAALVGMFAGAGRQAQILTAVGSCLSLKRAAPLVVQPLHLIWLLPDAKRNLSWLCPLHAKGLP